MAAHTRVSKRIRTGSLRTHYRDLGPTQRSTSNVPNGSQTIIADTKSLKSQLSASKKSRFILSHFTFHISLLSARLAPHSKQLQRRESHQTIRSCPKNCTDPTARNVQRHLVSVNCCHAIPRTASHNAMLFRSRVYM